MAKQRMETISPAPRPMAPPAAEPAPVEAPPPGPRKYRVSLTQFKCRVVDAEGRVSMQDYLDVEALSPGDAIQKFREYNGITATSQQFSTQLLE